MDEANQRSAGEPEVFDPDVFGDHLINQLFELWVDGELERRGEGLERSDVRKALVELPPGRLPTVRLNEEVVLYARAVASAAIEAGTAVTADNIRSLEELWPANVEPNSGWMAYFEMGGEAYVAFDFRYNKEKATELLSLARRYLRAAEAVVEFAAGPAIDNLYSAAELSVQAQMLSQSQQTREHRVRGSWLQHDGEMGNAPTGFADTLQRLRAERAAARYGDGESTLREQDIRELAGRVVEMIDHASSRVGKPLETPTGAETARFQHDG